MAKVKYTYDSKTLSYKKIDRSWKVRLKEFSLFAFVSMAFGFVFYLAADLWFESPKERKMKRELDNMVIQYDLMNGKLDQLADVLGDIEKRDDEIYRTIFEAGPIPNEVRTAGFGGANRYKNLEGFNNSELLIDSRKKLDQIAGRAYVQTKSFDDVVEMARDKEKMLAAIPAIQPVANKNLKRMASGYGYRIHPIYKVRKMHWGTDFSAPTGTPIYATGDGKVTKYRRSRAGYGNHIIIDHGYGYQTLYAHMSKVDVRRGQKVKRGDIIGYIGSSGRSTAPHLHYEVIKDGRKINPVNYFFNDLSPEEYEMMLEFSSNSNQSFD
ncbi:MAG TPA: peptidase M23 [Cryomorphaceae bacterium]|nr:peptidase M23 [Cryomorphaceae bacterium]|tara:strand:- start:891 stop:1862 length:972 start_codon:yes stop_codon:yes gene_type:complete